MSVLDGLVAPFAVIDVFTHIEQGFEFFFKQVNLLFMSLFFFFYFILKEGSQVFKIKVILLLIRKNELL